MTTETTDPSAPPTAPPGAPDARPDGPPDTPRRLHADPGPADRVFRGVARAGGGLVLAVMLLVGGFLLHRARQALGRAGGSFLTTENWEPDAGRFGIAAVLVVP
ncbi:hypothetical protein ACFW57_30620, partial [Streptomyces sp. NPDC058757]